MSGAARSVSGKELPLGPSVDTTPARRPEPIVFEGRFGRVEKLDPQRHGPSLWEAVRGEDAIFTYVPFGPFADADALMEFLADRAAREDPYVYSILDREDRALGFAMLMEIRPAMRVIEVGGVLYGPALARTPLATEAQYLLARYAFETLGYRRYEWKCNALNAASRRAGERLGFRFEGIFRQHQIVKGRSRDTAWFAMLDSEWPACRAAFERWLAPENFDAHGRQRRRLEELRGVEV